MRARDRMLQLTARIASSLLWWASSYHLQTDPACSEYVPPRAGSRLDRTSRGYSCNRCMRMRAIGYIQTSPDSGREADQ